ncbi:MAG: hypothetical protein QM279_10675 [Atribacterota bacterium]|nr:hypothetical protein [Atribacterota bacterium]
MTKYYKVLWQEKGKDKSSIIGLAYTEGVIKVRWLKGSALPVVPETLDFLEKIVAELKRNDCCYYPYNHYRLTERWGSSGCVDIIILEFPFSDEFMDFGFISSHIHVSMCGRFNEREIFEGNSQYFKTLIERLKEIFCDDDYTDDGDIKNFEFTEVLPWGKYKTKKNIIDEETYEYEKF